jgi:hypothetical protein
MLRTHAKNPIVASLAVATLILLFPAACGPDKGEPKKEEKPSGDASAMTVTAVTLDGENVPFMTPGETIAYEGKLAEDEGVYTYSESRALRVTEATTLTLANLRSTSLDCVAGDDFAGPDYLLLKLDGERTTIVRSTIQITGDGVTIPATDPSEFPGALEPGTYVLSVDYLSGSKACTVKGAYSLQ